MASVYILTKKGEQVRFTVTEDYYEVLDKMDGIDQYNQKYPSVTYVHLTDKKTRKKRSFQKRYIFMFGE